MAYSGVGISVMSDVISNLCLYTAQKIYVHMNTQTDKIGLM